MQMGALGQFPAFELYPSLSLIYPALCYLFCLLQPFNIVLHSTTPDTRRGGTPGLKRQCPTGFRCNSTPKAQRCEIYTIRAVTSNITLTEYDFWTDLLNINLHNLTVTQGDIQDIHLSPVAELKGISTVDSADVKTSILHLDWTYYQVWGEAVWNLKFENHIY